MYVVYTATCQNRNLCWYNRGIDLGCEGFIFAKMVIDSRNTNQKNFHQKCSPSLSHSLSAPRVVPILEVSSVTGENLDLLQQFLNLVPLPLHSRQRQQRREQRHIQFQVDEIFSVPDAGTVLGGVLTR